MRVGSVIFALTGYELTLARDARADASGCEGIRVRQAADLPPAWAASVTTLRREIDAAVSDASCAEIILSLEPTSRESVRLTAMTSDGRYAEREVLRPSALVATALGLVASIPDEAPEDEPVRETADAEPQPITHRSLRAVRDGRSLGAASTPAPPASHLLALSMAGALGARLTGSTNLELIDLEGRFDALLRQHWLFSASVRYAPTVGPHPDDTEFDELVAGIGAGGRIPLGVSTLDLSVSPSFALMTMKWDADLPDAGSKSATAFRLGLSARWSAPLSDSWRFAVTADVDANPWAIGRDPSLGPTAPALPVWTSGLSVGGIGELL